MRMTGLKATKKQDVDPLQMCKKLHKELDWVMGDIYWMDLPNSAIPDNMGETEFNERLDKIQELVESCGDWLEEIK